MDKKEENIPPSLLKGLSFMTTAYNMRIRREIKQEVENDLKNKLKIELQEQLQLELKKMKKELYQYIDYEIKKYGENHEIIHDYIKIN